MRIEPITPAPLGDGGSRAPLRTHSRGLARLRRVFRAAAILWLNVCLLFVTANLAAYLALAFLPAPDQMPAATHINAALHELFPDLKDEDLLQLMRENAREFAYEPFTEFREKPSSGRYVNVDANGFRRSREQGPWPPAGEFFNVFVFGGSTAFGIGVPDDQTVASHLQTILDTTRDAGRPVRVYNFGRGAYYSSQERALFERLLVAGHVPDLAVFLDGLNDFFFYDGDRPALTQVLEQLMEQTVPAPVGMGVALRPDRRGLAYTTLIDALPVVRLLARWRWTPPQRNVMLWRPGGEQRRRPAYDDGAVSDWVIGRYAANRTLIEAAAAAMGVTAVFVWQPVPLYKYDLRYHRYHGDFGRYEYMRFGYPRMAEYVRRHPQGTNFVWCADIQEALQELLYVDQVHYSPKMSERVARCIADHLRQRDLVQ
jgi:hypothetical protein